MVDFAGFVLYMNPQLLEVYTDSEKVLHGVEHLGVGYFQALCGDRLKKYRGSVKKFSHNRYFFKMDVSFDDQNDCFRFMDSFDFKTYLDEINKRKAENPEVRVFHLEDGDFSAYSREAQGKGIFIVENDKLLDSHRELGKTRIVEAGGLAVPCSGNHVQNLAELGVVDGYMNYHRPELRILLVSRQREINIGPLDLDEL